MDAAFLANVIVAASLYGLVAVGYVVIYRASRVLNFAQGHFMLLGAHLFFSLAGRVHVPWLVLVPVAVALTGVLGTAVYLACLRPLAGRPPFAGTLATIALGTVLSSVATLVWSARSRYAADVGVANPVRALPAGVTLTDMGLVLVGAGVVSLGALLVFLYLTRVGIQMRASAVSPRLAALRGVSLDAVLALSWAIATFAGALAGTLYALNSSLDPGLSTVGLKAFPAALLGGLDSVPGAALGALVVALVEGLTLRYGDPLLSQVSPYLVMLVVLAIRPWGLLGTEEEIERV